MYRTGWGSCNNNNKLFHAGYKSIARGHKSFFTLGDFPYLDEDSGGATTLDKDSTVADITTHYTVMWAIKGMIALSKSNVNIYMMADDHEWMGDNWDQSIASANALLSGLGLSDDVTGQTEANTHYERCTDAWNNQLALYANNPTNTDTEAVTDVPAEASTHGATPTTAYYAPKYYRVMKDIDGNVVTQNPHAEYFVLDCIAHRSPFRDTDNDAKSMLGLAGETTHAAATEGQYYWLLQRLLASTATFKFIMSPKKTFKNTGVGANNTDTWGEYTTERDLILDFIAANSITGVIWLCGDQHIPQVINTDTDNSDTYDHLCVCACPTGIALNAGAANTELDGGVVQFFSATTDQCFGEVEVYTDYVILRIINTYTGRIMWTDRVLAGQNKLDRTTISVAI